VTEYPFRVPTEMHLSTGQRRTRLELCTNEKSWLKFANSMLECVFSAMVDVALRNGLRLRTTTDPDSRLVSIDPFRVQLSEQFQLLTSHSASMNAFWDDYVAWDYKDSSELCKVLKSRRRRLAKLLAPLETVRLSTTSSKGQRFLCEEYDHSTQHCMSRDAFFSSCREDIVKKHDPHPPYTTCTPISQNIAEVDDLFLTGEGYDAANDSKLPFMPFSDDERFDANSYGKEFAEFCWQGPNFEEPSSKR